MQRHIVVESAVAVKSLKQQHFVSGGRAAGNVSYQEIYRSRPKSDSQPACTLELKDILIQVDVTARIWSHQNHVWMGHLKGHKQAGLQSGPGP